ncbi:MAG: protein phosphatase 2C domain-containing protein [Ardenticatenia bacterium]|nr:protein phosphatase 2C domain-containing protein [Ardenticatenia bacterium]
MSASSPQYARTAQVRLLHGHGTDQGRRREQNEDAVWSGVVTTASGHHVCVLLVADGIGGHAGGKVASNTVVEVMRGVLRQSLVEEEDIKRLPNHLLHAVREANRKLRTMINEEPKLKDMGTTLVAALVTEDGRCCVVHMGDSRAYLVRNGTAFLLTVDHTWVLEALRVGRLSPEEARKHPNRHVVNQFLAGQVEIHPDFKVVRPGAYTDPFLLPSESDLLDTSHNSLQLHPGDALVLCTDGLSDVVPPKLIADLVNRATQNPTHAMQALISAANAAGGPDNIGVAVLYAAPPDAAAQTKHFVPPGDGRGRVPRRRGGLTGAWLPWPPPSCSCSWGPWALACGWRPATCQARRSRPGPQRRRLLPSPPWNHPPRPAATPRAQVLLSPRPRLRRSRINKGPRRRPKPHPSSPPPRRHHGPRHRPRHRRRHPPTQAQITTPNGGGDGPVGSLAPPSPTPPPGPDPQQTASCRTWAETTFDRLGAPTGPVGDPITNFEVLLKKPESPPQGCLVVLQAQPPAGTSISLPCEGQGGSLSAPPTGAE